MKQDRNGVRTAQDLERKYDLSSIGTLKRNYELQKTSLNKVENELNNFVSATTQNIEELQNQVDGNITTWFSSGIPTINNYPASEWEDDDTRNNHLGDLYYDRETGYAYRFTLEENTYQWIDIKDTDVTQALALANAAQDTADSKRRVFVVQPSPPYDVGDLWLRNEELYRCQITKGENESYAERDWIKATKYTDDTVAYQVDGKLTILSGTVTEIKDNVDELSTTMTNTTRLVNEQGETIGTLQEQQSSTKQTVNEISATVSSHGNKITSLEQTVEVFSVDLDIYNITIPVDTNNKPLENKTYQIGYYAYYKGSQVSPSVSSQSSATGISQNISNNKINLSVSTSTTISNLTNELIYQFSYTADGETHNVTKKIIVVISQKGEQGIQGIQGQPGIPGQPGADGTSTYFYVRYSANSSGSPMTTAPQSDTQYMGVASTTSSTAPTSPSAYTWSKTKGEQGIQGIQGQTGADGRSSYLHIKYSEDGTTFTPAQEGYPIGKKPSRWQGTYVDFNATDSNTFSDYNWVDTAIMVEDLLTPTNTLSGTLITTNDSADADLLYLEVEGKTTQETRSGKNLLNITTTTTTQDGITYTIHKDKSITINGTNTKSSTSWFRLAPNFNLPAGTYTLSNGNSNVTYNTFIFYDDKGNIPASGNVSSKTFTSSIEVAPYIRIGGGQTINNQTIYPMIVEGSYTVQTLPTYEQYGLMPSPDYPSELVNVGYHNLLNVDKSNIVYPTTETGFRAIMSVNEGIITFNGRPTTSGGTNMYFGSFQVKESGYYRFSTNMENAPTGSSTNMILQRSSDNSSWSTLLEFSSAGTLQSTVVELDKNLYYRLRFYGSVTTNFVNTIFKPLLVKGIKKYGFVPYSKYGVEIENINKNILDFDDFLKHSNSIYTKSDNVYSITNVAQGYSRQYVLNLRPNTTYTLSQIYQAQSSTNLRLEILQDYRTIVVISHATNQNLTTRTFTTNSTSVYTLRINYTSNIYPVIFNKPMLEINPNKTDFEEHKSNSQLYVLDEPLRAIGQYQDKLYVNNGVLFVERKIGSIVLNGSEVGWSNQGGQAPYSLIVDNLKRINSQVMVKSSNFMGVSYNSNWTIYNALVSTSTASSSIKLIKFKYVDMATLDNFKSWLSTHNTEVQYLLAEPYTEELGQVEMPSTYKGITYLNTTDELEPNISIIYVRDLPLTNYVESHYAELKIKEDGIETRVESIENNGYGDRISAVETKQTSADLKVNVISTNSGIELDYDSEGKPISGKVREVTTTTGFTFNAEGMTIADSSSSFKAQHKKDGTYYYDGDTIVGQYTKDGSKQKDLELFGVYTYGKNDLPDTPMFVAQLYTDKNGEECFGHFYNRGD